MTGTILITGAGLGLGEGAALGLARSGRQVIAGVQIWPQATALRQKAAELHLDTLRVEKLDILDPYDINTALTWDVDVLVNNAAIGNNGPLAEIPVDLVRRTFETNVFGTLDLTQRFVRKFVDQGRGGRIVFVSSMGGLLSPAGLGPYCASKHAVEAVAETLRDELAPYNIRIQTINPGPYKTGFNDTMAETTYHWHNDADHFTREDDIRQQFSSLMSDQFDPQQMIDAMVDLIGADHGKFRNVVPESVEALIKTTQSEAWTRSI